MKLMSVLACAVLPAFALAQNAPPVEFEVASIRPVSPAETRIDIGMHIDGAEVRFNYLSLRDLMRIAYEMKNDQFAGPDWIASEHFNIAAKLPDGAGRDQVRAMLRNLLLDRFRMTIHRETKEFPVYALTLGKTGLKLKETPSDNTPAGGDAPQPLLDVKATASAGGVFADLGNGAYFTFVDNRLTGHKLPMWRIADLLETFMDKPVVDMTGLNSAISYDISLEITPEDYRTMQIRGALKSGMSLPADAARLADLPVDSLWSAIEAAGLRMESRKAPRDIIVIDHAEKAPTEN